MTIVIRTQKVTISVTNFNELNEQSKHKSKSLVEKLYMNSGEKMAIDWEE